MSEQQLGLREYAAIHIAAGLFASGHQEETAVAMRAVRAADALITELRRPGMPPAEFQFFPHSQ